MDKGQSSSGHRHLDKIFEQFKSVLANPEAKKQGTSPHWKDSVHLPAHDPEIPSPAHTKATFMAFVDAIIPSTLGALDLRLDEYMIWSLNHYIAMQGEWGVKTIPLSTPVAQLLDIGASHQIVSGSMRLPDFSVNPDGGPFASLSSNDRLEAVRLLENTQVDLHLLPLPFQNNADLVKNIVTVLHQMVMFGYYSEWFSYGATRLAYPEDRRQERQPFIWDSLGYPGPSYGHRSLRGFLVKEFADGEGRE
ncbi:hypothetical protein [Salsuginibacillus kocurii]|uniref:hypothetical protein n=1 Tax=Salsuginibacillus kocurii TaxID=427078 RepID=UPI00036F5A24|nr:hypothetical protein [Salsuginibacillus kocurii]